MILCKIFKYKIYIYIMTDISRVLLELYNEKKIERQLKRKEYLKGYNKQYYLKHKQKNKDKVLSMANNYYHSNKERISKERKIKYYAKKNHKILMAELLNQKINKNLNQISK